MQSTLGLLLALRAAVAWDVVLTVQRISPDAASMDAASPVTPPGVGVQDLRCEAVGVEPGALLSASPLTVAGAEITTLLAVEGWDPAHGIRWRPALRIKQPGLLSIAPADRQGPLHCPLQRPCGQRFSRQEQSLLVTVTFGGEPPPPPPAASPDARPPVTWDTASWYREATPMRCEPLGTSSPSP